MADPDWALWRSFGAVVEHGSLSAAARHIGSSQPTIGRHIETLEQQLGLTLFERTLQGLKPTDTALKLYEPISGAQRAIAEAVMMAEGTATTLTGTVRLTSSAVTSHFILPPFLRQLREEFPAIALELVSSDSAENLLLREADIAVRMFRPTQLELITRKIGTSPIICCAHESYIQSHGVPTSIADLINHDLIGFDRSELIIGGAREMGFALRRENFIVRTESQTAMWQLMVAGLGIGFGQLHIVNRTPGMVHLLPEFRAPDLEVWLTTHRELFTSRRIRAIYDRLAELLGAYFVLP